MKPKDLNVRVVETQIKAGMSYIAGESMRQNGASRRYQRRYAASLARKAKKHDTRG